MKIIDFDKKGNVVRFFLGEKTEDWGWVNKDYKDYKGNTPDWLKPCDKYYGDDWDDAPYDCNAGEVYDEFIKGHIDVAFPFDFVVLEPCNGIWDTNCRWTKDDMRDEKTPCIVAFKIPEGESSWNYDNFDKVVAIKDSTKIYFNTDEEELKKIVEEIGGVIFS